MPNGGGPEDESFWASIALDFELDPTLVFLNSASMSATSRAAAAIARLTAETTNLAPPYYLGTVLQPSIEVVRSRLAEAFGCDREELAFARNATIGMDQCIFGIPLSRGDEVVITDQEFPAMIRAWEQRAAREGIVVRRVVVPVPYQSDEQFCSALEAELTPLTRLIMLSQVTYTVGQELPVAAVTRIAHARGIAVLVDGAQGFAHFPTSCAALDCDYYVTSLHKWLMSPPTSGFTYVRRELIPALEPLIPPKSPMPDNVRKLEQTGAQGLASIVAVADALAFEAMIGETRKAERLRHLTMTWIAALSEDPRVRLLTTVTPTTPRGIAVVAIDGVDVTAVANQLWADYRILVSTWTSGAQPGLRVSTQVYTRAQDIAAFIAAMRKILAGS